MKQVAVAGGDRDLAQVVGTLGSEVFLVSDATFGAAAESLEPLYANGAVPST